MTKRLDYIPGTTYKIWQDDKDFSFTTDAVFLGNFPHIVNQAKVLDLGCGTGAVGLICKNRGAKKITALDINNNAIQLLNETIIENNLQEEFATICGDIKNYKKILQNESFDLAVANPPYRTAGAKRIIGKAACHEENASLEDFFKAAAYAVKYRGRFALVQLPERFQEAMHLAEKYNLQPKRLQWVHSDINKPAWIFLMEMQKGGSYGLEVLPPKIGRGVQYDNN